MLPRQRATECGQGGPARPGAEPSLDARAKTQVDRSITQEAMDIILFNSTRFDSLKLHTMLLQGFTATGVATNVLRGLFAGHKLEIVCEKRTLFFFL